VSEMATETPAQPKAGKRENVFTHKFGPLPMWAWVAIVAAVLIGYYYWKNKKAAAQQQTSPTGAGQVPQFVNQVYTSVVPPTAPEDEGKEKEKEPKDVDLAPWKDEARKAPKIKAWEHKHHQEYPFNSWQGEPTKEELAAFKANPEFQPAMTQSQGVPAQAAGPMVMPMVPPKPTRKGLRG
jgi:hypothetical protein